jgi:hypothetical protein
MKIKVFKHQEMIKFLDIFAELSISQNTLNMPLEKVVAMRVRVYGLHCCYSGTKTKSAYGTGYLQYA